jgi:hypothetical protein
LGSAYWLAAQRGDERVAVLGGGSVPMEPMFARTTNGGESWFITSLYGIAHGDGDVTGVHFWTADHGIAA